MEAVSSSKILVNSSTKRGTKPTKPSTEPRLLLEWCETEPTGTTACCTSTWWYDYRLRQLHQKKKLNKSKQNLSQSHFLHNTHYTATESGPTEKKKTAITPLIFDPVTFLLEPSLLNTIWMNLDTLFSRRNPRYISSLHNVSLVLQCFPTSVQLLIELGRKPVLGSQLNTKY